MPTANPAFQLAALNFDDSRHIDLGEFYSRLRILYAERQDPRAWMTFRKD